MIDLLPHVLYLLYTVGRMHSLIRPFLPNLGRWSVRSTEDTYPYRKAENLFTHELAFNLRYGVLAPDPFTESSKGASYTSLSQYFLR